MILRGGRDWRGVLKQLEGRSWRVASLLQQQARIAAGLFSGAGGKLFRLRENRPARWEGGGRERRERKRRREKGEGGREERKEERFAAFLSQRHVGRLHHGRAKIFALGKRR
jgi:hypothetical protein